LPLLRKFSSLPWARNIFHSRINVFYFRDQSFSCASGLPGGFSSEGNDILFPSVRIA
jgi:hypothetical protein